LSEALEQKNQLATSSVTKDTKEALAFCEQAGVASQASLVNQPIT
jgi:hypothetical protein